MSKRFYLNNDWYFAEDWDKPEFRKVRLPHTCKELSLHYFDEREYQMLCGYAREVFVPAEWQGSVLLLTFEGAAQARTNQDRYRYDLYVILKNRLYDCIPINVLGMPLY